MGRSAASDDLDATVAGLYRLPLAEFVAARDRLARQLRAAGDRPAGRVAAGLHFAPPPTPRRRAAAPALEAYQRGNGSCLRRSPSARQG